MGMEQDSRPRGAAGRQSGQAMVEAAMIMPLAVFMTLGIIQLTLIQHAKLMTEYAAYQAARAGIVWNGNNERMHDAAIVALLPTLGRTDDIGNLAKTFAIHQIYDSAMRTLNFGGGVVPRTVNGSNLFGLIRVDTINPAYFTPINTIWKLRTGFNWQELDFDGSDSFPEVPSLENNIRKFFNLPEPDDSELVYRKATRLTIRLRYFYEMKVPFANWIIFTAWYASNAQVALRGAIDRATLVPKSNMMSDGGNLTPLAAMAKGIDHEQGYNSLYPAEMWVLWGLATGSIPLVSSLVGKRYFMPLSATYTMRMQSNFHRKWIMHLNPDWGM
ncbi:pilus assembly protein [Myxococcus sp. CA051A]|uniref:TadE/TadG family type IV pilus assembly protein n=1 Tax=unclassified Myxococcus TaxID=2648731 RepID=UPI00157B8AE0|nr:MULTISPECIES: TadE family protein [unclassified Myxococcus]NTX16218.1 pilus assembly protein [Myxococcus sp. CA056]NTX63031.1 pilus assembly protein [Myxococcus sp. CA051A]